MSSYTILIVDDDRNVRDALSRWFEIRGFSVETAEDGIDALDKCRARRFDVITLDLEMPRMNGIDALEHIRALQPGVPVAVLTGYPRDADAAYARGAAKVLVKPMRLTALEEELRELLVAREQAGQETSPQTSTYAIETPVG